MAGAGMTRRWLDIPDAAGRYQVSDDGFVRSLPEVLPNGRFMDGLILRHAVNEKGYCHVALGSHGTFKVARLVAQAFVPNPGNLPQVNHEDGDKQNNHYKNLEWTTNSGNQLHRYRVLKHTPHGTGKRGIACANSKPVVGRSVASGQIVGVYGSASEAGRVLNICASGISQAALGGIRAYRGTVWEYVSREAYAESVDGP